MSIPLPHLVLTYTNSKGVPLMLPDVLICDTSDDVMDLLQAKNVYWIITNRLTGAMVMTNTTIVSDCYHAKPFALGRIINDFA